MSGRRSLRRLLGVIVLCLTGTVAFAQTGQKFGELVGKVADDQGAVLPGVTVTLSGPAVMGAQTAVTNERGGFRFPAVNSGTYNLTFELAGFAPLVRDGIVVPVRQTITVDAAMKLATLQETVTVSGRRRPSTSRTRKSARVSTRRCCRSVPTSRTIFGSTTVLPGMTMGRQDPGGLNAATSTGMVAHGAANYNLNYYGVTADTPQNYGSMYYMDFGSAEEISVDTAAMGAEIGGGGGANINIIPKSGGNTVKGALLLQRHRQGYCAGNNIDDELRAQGITGTRLRKLNDFNADAGGPFIKDRLWWFGSVRNYTTVRAGHRIPEGLRVEPAQLHGEHQVSGQQEQPAVRLLDLQQEVPAEPRRRDDAAQPDQHAQPAVAEEPVQRQLDVGAWPEHDSSKCRRPTSTCTGRAAGPTSSTPCPQTSRRRRCTT